MCMPATCMTQEDTTPAVPDILRLISHLVQAQSSRFTLIQPLNFPFISQSIILKINTEYEGLKKCCKFPSGVRARAPAANMFVAFYKVTSGLWLTNKRDFYPYCKAINVKIRHLEPEDYNVTGVVPLRCSRCMKTCRPITVRLCFLIWLEYW